ncbi:MAG TPA: hypothetical protein VGZ32_01965 [Actinocrinis sp.]|jgi:hypothetical protein|uniref:hypothetical protein n=1 Tax=Actinocrinis sp. TaxID=1920516 RepID=UPI002DDD91A9|nr:hypothetical protein [Actinocrinis sp.]HEV3169073.1 hypothetical protein [Actinocrinis sp.]
MAGSVPQDDVRIADAIAERLFQADMDVHFAFSLVRDERTADLFSHVIDQLEGLIRMVQDVAGDGQAQPLST